MNPAGLARWTTERRPVPSTTDRPGSDCLTSAGQPTPAPGVREHPFERINHCPYRMGLIRQEGGFESQTKRVPLLIAGATA